MRRASRSCWRCRSFSAPAPRRCSTCAGTRSRRSAAAALVVGFVASAAVGYAAVRFLLQYLKTRTLQPFGDLSGASRRGASRLERREGLAASGRLSQRRRITMTATGRRDGPRWRRSRCALAARRRALRAAPPEKPADLLFTNGAVYTVDAARSWADSVAVRGGRIVYVGPPAGAKAFQGPGTRVVDLKGRMLLPAFHDAHVHPVSGGMELALCNLNDARAPAKRSSTGSASTRRRTPRRSGSTAAAGICRSFPARTRPASSSTRSWRIVRPPSRRPTGIPPGSTRRRSRSPASRARRRIPPTDASSAMPTGIPPARCASRRSASSTGTSRTRRRRRTPKGFARGLEMANRFGITSLIEANAGDAILAAYARGGARGMAVARGSSRRSPSTS